MGEAPAAEIPGTGAEYDLPPGFFDTQAGVVRQTPTGWVVCDIDPSGYQRNCRLDAGRPLTTEDRRNLLSEEGRRLLTAGDGLPTADAPPAFRGWWVEPGKACDAWADDSQLRIGVNLVQFYAGEGRVAAVREVGPREAVLTLDMHTDPGGEEPLHLRLSEDGQRLFQMDLDGGYERLRCEGWPG